MAKGFPIQTPNPSFTSAAGSGTPTIASAPGTVAVTAPAIKGGDVEKKIEATIAIVGGASESLIVSCEKDGVQFGEFYGLSVTAGPTFTFSGHWVDTAPGKAEPVYRVRITASTGGASALSSRRITVFNL